MSSKESNWLSVAAGGKEQQVLDLAGIFDATDLLKSLGGIHRAVVEQDYPSRPSRSANGSVSGAPGGGVLAGINTQMFHLATWYRSYEMMY